MYEFKDFKIIATVDITTLLTPIVKEAVENAINFQIEEYITKHKLFYDSIKPSDVTVVIVPVLDDYLIMIKSNDPASNITMFDSVNSWIPIIKQDHEIWGD